MQHNRSGAEEVGGNKGLCAGGHFQLFVEADFDYYMSGIAVVVFDFAHDADFETVECHRRGLGQTFYVGVRSIVVVGGLEDVEPFEEIDTEEEDEQCGDSQNAYEYFFAKNLFHVMWLQY